MKDRVRFAFTEVDPKLGALSTLPYLPIILSYQNRSIRGSGLLDTGSSVNVLPYEMGLNLGAVWENQTISLRLGGNLANTEARALFIDAFVADFDKIQLAFAWSKSDNVPVLLGQTNFLWNSMFCSRVQLYFLK